MGQEGALARRSGAGRRRSTAHRAPRRRAPPAGVREHRPERQDVRAPRGLVERDAEMVGVDQAQVDARRPPPGRRAPAPGPARAASACRKTPGSRPRRPRARRPAARIPVRRWTRRAIAAMPAGPCQTAYMRRHHREQDLGGADVAGRLLAPDVLLAGLQRHAQRRPARRCRPRRRSGGRASRACRRRGWRRTRHAGRHSPSARRSAARCRSRCRRPARRAGSAARGSTGRRPRPRARRAACSCAITGRRSRTAPLEPG